MKEQVISFKVDEELFKLLNRIPNKSEFIRNSILRSLDKHLPPLQWIGDSESLPEKTLGYLHQTPPSERVF